MINFDKNKLVITDLAFNQSALMQPKESNFVVGNTGILFDLISINET